MSEAVVGAFALGFGVGLIVTGVGVAWLVASGSWRKAKFSGISIPLAGIVGMRLRGTPPDLIVDAAVAVEKRGFAAPWMQVEAVYLAQGNARMDSHELAALVEKALEPAAVGSGAGTGSNDQELD